MADARLIISAIDQASKEIGKIGGSIDGMVSKLKGLAGGLTFGFAVKEFVQAADAMTLMNARLQLVTSSTEEFNEARAESYRIAQANNLGLGETTELYTKLAPAVKALGGSTREVSGIVDAFATSLRVGGANTQAAAAATLQFAQAMASGRLNGDEFRTMAETSPRFMKALADGMGVTTGALKDMSKEGKLTADVVGNALLKELAALKDEAAKIPDTVGGALQRAKNDALLFAEQIEKATGASGQMADVIGTTSGLFREFSDAIGAASLELDTANQQFDLAGTAIAAIGTIVETLTVVFANVAYVAKTTATEIAVMWQQAKLYLSGNAEEARRIGDEWTKQAEANRRAIDKFSEGVVGATDRILQQRDALKNHSISSKEANSELERMSVRSGKAAGEFVKLASNVKNSNEQQKAAKKAAEEYGKAAKDVLDLTSKSLGVSGDYVEKLKALELWYSRNQDKTEEYRQALLALIWAQDSSKRILKEQEDAEKAIAKALEDTRVGLEKSGQAYRDETSKIIDKVNSLELEARQLGLTQDQQAALTREQREAEIVRLQSLATSDMVLLAGEEEVANINDRIDALRRLNAAEGNLAAKGAMLEAAKATRDEWTRTTTQIEDALTRALVDGFNGGKSVVKSIGEYIVNYFKTYVARSIAQALMGAIGIGTSGASAASTGGSLLNLGSLFGGSGSSGGFSIGNLFSGASSLLGSGASLGTFGLGLSGTLAGIGELGFLGGFGGAMTSAGSLLSGGSILGAAGAAMPYLLPAIAGVYALTKLLGNDRSPAQQVFSNIGPGDIGYGRLATNPTGANYDEVLRPIIQSVEEIVAKLGGTAGATTYGLFTSASPDNLGAQVVANVLSQGSGNIFYTDTNASNESMQQRIADALPQMLLAGLKDANLPEEFASYFRDLNIGTATAKEINDAIAAAVQAKEAQDADARAAQDATLETAEYTSRSADLLSQQITILDRIASGIDRLIDVTADVARRPIEISVPEVNGGMT